MNHDTHRSHQRTARRALAFIFVLGLGGLAFSGYLTWRELFAPAQLSVASCTPVGPQGTILGLPPCVYGFVMYLAITVAAGIGLLSQRAHRAPPPARVRQSMTSRDRPAVPS